MSSSKPLALCTAAYHSYIIKILQFFIHRQTLHYAPFTALSGMINQFKTYGEAFNEIRLPIKVETVMTV